MSFLWDQEKGMYCDCMDSEKKGYSIQTNIFSVIFNVADSEKKKAIIDGLDSNTQQRDTDGLLQVL